MPSRLRAHRMERMKVAELRRGVHLLCDVAALEAVDLVERDHDGDAECEHALRDEPVARADALARGEDEQDGVDALERRVDGVLHPLGERVERALEAGQVGEDELVVVAVRDPEDAPPGRLRLVGDDRDLAAAERVHKRRLADVRAAGDRHDPARHASGRSQVSGSKSAGAYSARVPSSRGKNTRPTRHS